MTSNKEDYLKVIFEEGGANTNVSNKVIAEKLGVSAASVSEMLKKLSREGLIMFESHRGSRLTNTGINICLSIVRNHRLWEVFLIEKLNYSWREAHEDAEILEHAAPIRMINRLEKFLGYPDVCPHGYEIPKEGKTNMFNPKFALTRLDIEESGIIIKVNEEGKLLDYLEQVGLILGSEIHILEKEDYEGPITFLQDGKKITISYKAANQIYVKKIFK